MSKHLQAKTTAFQQVTLAKNITPGNFRFTLTKIGDIAFVPVVDESPSADYDFGDYETNYGEYSLLTELLGSDGNPVIAGVVSTWSNPEPVIAQAPAAVTLENVTI